MGRTDGPGGLERPDDWAHPGGHIAAPLDVQIKALGWLLAQRDATVTDTREAALLQAAEWRAQVSAGRVDEVITECLATLREQPRTWAANHARVILGEAVFTIHPILRVHPNLPRTGGDLAMDYLFFYAYGAELARHSTRAWNALQILAGLTDSSHDREADVAALLEKLPVYWPPPLSFTEWSEDRLAEVAPALRQPDSDASQDGVANFAAFGLGLDPMQNNSSRAQPFLEVIEADSRHQLNLLFRQSIVAGRLQHRIEVSTDLHRWFPSSFNRD